MNTIKSLFFAFLFSSCSSYAAAQNTQPFLGQTKPTSEIFLGLDSKNNPTYFMRGADGEIRVVQSAVLDKMMKSAFESAKSFACSQSIVPESVSVSVGVLSASWNTVKLCETTEKKK